MSFHAFGYARGIAEDLKAKDQDSKAKGSFRFQIQMPWWPGMISLVVYDWPRIGIKWDGPDMILKANTNYESRITEEQNYERRNTARGEMRPSLNCFGGGRLRPKAKR